MWAFGHCWLIWFTFDSGLVYANFFPEVETCTWPHLSASDIWNFRGSLGILIFLGSSSSHDLASLATSMLDIPVWQYSKWDTLCTQFLCKLGRGDDATNVLSFATEHTKMHLCVPLVHALRTKMAICNWKSTCNSTIKRVKIHKRHLFLDELCSLSLDSFSISLLTWKITWYIRTCWHTKIFICQCTLYDSTFMRGTFTSLQEQKKGILK